MLHKARCVLSRVAETGAQQQQQPGFLVAIGLYSELPALWPVPLPPCLPKNQGKHTLVLDIDETLIHTFGMAHHKPNLSSEAVSHVKLVDYHILTRPHLKEFLLEVNELFEVVFWTAGTASYCSAVMDALETQVLQLPPSFYNYKKLLHGVENSSKGGTDHVNFYSLSRTQTLENHGYMKYLPMLGRPINRVVIVDDNVRSFPLTPRNAIKVPPFEVDDATVQNYMHALSQTKEGSIDIENLDERVLKFLKAGMMEIERLEKDRALLDILPVLRAVASVPSDGNIIKELDHWRDLDYVRCDDFAETMNPRTVTRQQILGTVLSSRREEPIQPLKQHYMNHIFEEEANSKLKMKSMRIDSRL
ncbi:unnamed protein product [Phytomonas sp. EM1]|nr:unnamed protein product [Phytomonas sp. EM1]|eukprot:CCW64371.1 unnamed protein product [Phytomonas sp. isolate EM1]